MTLLYTDEQLAQFGLSRDRLPAHIAIIMDGNGRWAQLQELPRAEGHRRGAERVIDIAEECTRLCIKQLTLYCLSSENWKRPADELEFLMLLLGQFLNAELPTMMKNNMRLATIGRVAELSEEARAELNRCIEATASHTGLTLCLALNYGGRGEIVDAVKRIAGSNVTPDDVDEETISRNLDTAEMPELDLMIRTANEIRVSNFLLWQLSYAELWFTSKFWPEFDPETLREALRNYATRERRFGGLDTPLPPH